MEQGIARTDIHLEGQTGQGPIHFHTLDRFDMVFSKFILYILYIVFFFF